MDVICVAIGTHNIQVPTGSNDLKSTICGKEHFLTLKDRRPKRYCFGHIDALRKTPFLSNLRLSKHRYDGCFFQTFFAFSYFDSDATGFPLLTF